ncbi:MAG TPA: MraY family glycosyltransferase [Candidatus Hydrogenedentes bacterium]|nr:MraY family glycosyltransferase [Candidatus Hydrogenedentota bacterium]HPU96570.1 MraY family glycosyltransferase [Candidatus Hydrogenedentota bacterium]
MIFPGPLEYLLTTAVAFLVAVATTPLFRAVARRYGILDHPVLPRKIHARSVPYLGGMAFLTAYLAVLVESIWRRPELIAPVHYPLAALGTVIILLGLADDIFDLSGIVKLLVELAVGGLLYYWAVGEQGLAKPLHAIVDLGPFAPAIAALWVAGVMNAINFTDGLDGLAAGLVAIASAMLLVVGIINQQPATCLVMATLLGSCLGFLVYNFHPASIFMGDAGALFLGFMLGGATLVEQQKGAAVVALLVPVITIALPIADTLLSFLRRLRRAREGQFFHPDREHLHHRLLALGLNQRRAVLTMYLFSFFMGLLAILAGVLPGRLKPAVPFAAAAFTAAAVLWLHRLEQRQRSKEQASATIRIDDPNIPA